MAKSARALVFNDGADRLRPVKQVRNLLVAAAILCFGAANEAAAQTGSLSVCADLRAPAGDVAYHCRLAIKSGGLSRQQALGANLNLGDALIALGQPDLAVDAFNAAAEINLSRVEIYVGRARAREAQGRKGEAMKDWDRALGLAKDSVDVRLGRGAFFLRGQDAARAEVEFTAALRREPDQPDALYNRGAANLSLGRMAEAERDLSRLIRSYPNDAGAHHLRARAREAANAQGALADYDKAAKLAPEWSEPWYFSGRLLDRLGRQAEANRNLRRAFELGHNDPWLLERIQELGG